MAAEIRVLHVDDEPEVVELSAEFLERADDRITVLTETSASAGLDRLAETTVDCIVSDYQMPVMDGLEFLAAVRRTRPDLPFVLFTGRGSEEVASDALSGGATDYLQKAGGSQQYELLANRIANAVESYRAQGRASTLERMRTLVSDVNRALIRASSREEIERRVCEIVSAVDPYRLVVITDIDPKTGRVSPREWAGGPDYLLDDLASTIDTEGLERRQEAPVVQPLPETELALPEPRTDAGVDEAAQEALRAVATVPLGDEERPYGRLLIFASRVDAFDDREQRFLVELGDNIAHAIHVAELRSERERYEMIVEAAGDPVYTLDPEGRFTFVNDALQATTGYAATDLLGEHVSVLMDDADIETGAALIQELVEDEDRNRGTFEMEAILADGSRLTCETHIALLSSGDEFRGTVGVVRDITERKQRERELERFETIMETLPVGAFSVDEEGTITEANDHAASMLGLTRREWMGEPFPQLVEEGIVPQSAVDEYLDGVRGLLSSDSDADEFQLETEIYQRDADERRIVNARFTLLPYESDFKGSVGVFQDITAHRERERTLERQNERLDEFAGIVSHDLRNPLNVAQGRLEMARAECDSEHLPVIEEVHARMETLLEDTLTLARQGDTVADPEPVSIRELAQRCWRVVDSSAGTLAVDEEFTVHGDPGRVRQVFENLFQNAVEHGAASRRADEGSSGTGTASAPPEIDAAEDGGQCVAVRVGRLDGRGFYVEDDGPGVPEDMREEIFDPGVTTTRSGTGFGLAIVREIVVAHGWEIDVTESDAGGARFEITGVRMD